MGLSAEVCTAWVRECGSIRELLKLAAEIEARVEIVTAKESAKAAKRK